MPSKGQILIILPTDRVVFATPAQAKEFRRLSSSRSLCVCWCYAWFERNPQGTAEQFLEAYAKVKPGTATADLFFPSDKE